jgi:hypothetical protein
MDQVTDQDPPETDVRPLAHAEKCRLSKLMLRIAGDTWGAPGSFVRAYLHMLDRTIRNADAQAAKVRKQRARRRDDEHQDE